MSCIVKFFLRNYFDLFGVEKPGTMGRVPNFLYQILVKQVNPRLMEISTELYDCIDIIIRRITIYNA